MVNAAAILEARWAQLTRLHPLKLEHREKAEELRESRRGLREQAQDRAEEMTITAGHAFDLFVTPSDLAARMVRIAAEVQASLPITPWLEPSAGTGRISEQIIKAGYGCHCIELNYSAAELLRKRGYTVTQGDFLTWEGTADIFVMNPPFSHNQDIEHVNHAYELLNPGGRIVAIMAPHAFFADDRQSRDFRAWFSGKVEDLPAGTFSASGTNVSAKLVTIDRPRMNGEIS